LAHSSAHYVASLYHNIVKFMILVDICPKDIDLFCIAAAPHLLSTCSSKLETDVMQCQAWGDHHQTNQMWDDY